LSSVCVDKLMRIVSGRGAWMKKFSLTMKVIAAVFSSIYLSIFFYSVVLPFLFLMPAEERFSFWVKMAVVVTILAPLCSFVVYLFYRPVARATKLAQEEQEIPEWLRQQALHSFRAIQGFLFMVGLLAYAAGAAMNFFAEVVLEHKTIDVFYWLCRLVLALSFGALNGLFTARMVNLSWLEAKYLLSVTDLESSQERYESTFQKIFMPAVLLLLFITVFSAVGVVYYVRLVALDGERVLSWQQVLLHFGFVEFFLFVTSAVLLAAILWENQSHINNLRNQISRLAEGEMNLSNRVYIVSFDDIGVMTAGINRILGKLQQTFLTIQQMQVIVRQSGEIAKNIMESSQAESAEAQHLVQEAGENYEAQVDVIREASDRFTEMMGEVRKAIEKFQSQQAVIFHASQSFQKVVATFNEMIDMTLNSTEKFSKLSGVINEGSSGLGELLEVSRALQTTNKRIGEIVKLIMDISDQSNILAMNAAIEASHAGEYGKGFAIVASEVRQLSIHTTDSARQIESLIHEMLQKSETSTTMNEKLSEIFQTMQNEMDAVTKQMETIASMASREASTATTSLEEMNEMLAISQQIAQNIQAIEKNDAAVSEIMGSLKETTERLAAISERLMKGISTISESYAKLSEAVEKSFEAIQQFDKAIASFRVE